MISAYQTIFDSIPYVSCIVAGLAVLSLAFQNRSVIARSIGFSFQFWMAPLFYMTYASFMQRFSAAVMIALCLELLFFAVYLTLFARLLTAVLEVTPDQLKRMVSYLKTGMWAIVILTVPVYLQSGVGIFSSGSRNEFLEGSRLNLYLVYSSALIQCSMIPIVAAIVNAERRWRRSVVIYLLMISALSVLSASKGGIFLNALAIISLLKFEHARDSFRVLFIPVACGATLFTVTVIVVGQFLSLNPGEMISLMFNRLFITNDCRALALDWSTYMGHDSASLFRESFRLYSALLGTPPQYPPLGQLVYELQFGTVGLQGANTSSTALLVAYGSDIEKICFAFLVGCTAITIGFLAAMPGRGRVQRLAIGIGWLTFLSQDFLAFQLWLNELIFLVVAGVVTIVLTKLLFWATNVEAEVQITRSGLHGRLLNPPL